MSGESDFEQHVVHIASFNEIAEPAMSHSNPVGKQVPALIELRTKQTQMFEQIRALVVGNYAGAKSVTIGDWLHDSLAAWAYRRAIQELRALPYVSEATASEIFDQINARASELLNDWIKEQTL